MKDFFRVLKHKSYFLQGSKGNLSLEIFVLFEWTQANVRLASWLPLLAIAEQGFPLASGMNLWISTGFPGANLAALVFGGAFPRRLRSTDLEQDGL